ncbi:MAG TPA: hypothetical protein VIO11_10395 [Candidatus Methanoperedens sp.]
MNARRSDDEKVLDVLMEDSLWLKKAKKEKKADEKMPDTGKQPEKIQTEAGIVKEEPVEHKNEPSKNNTYTINEAETPEEGFGEVDYAILKSVTYGFKDIKQISKALQIRSFVIEKHINKLIKEGYIKYFQYCVLTSNGKEALDGFEKNNPEDVWKPIDEFIVSVTERNNKRNLKLQKTLDIILLIATIILIILIVLIYFGIIA